MCTGGAVPNRPAKQPEAPVAPTADLSSSDANRRRQRRAGSGSTLLTSGQGVQSNAQTQQKTLLGA